MEQFPLSPKFTWAGPDFCWTLLRHICWSFDLAKSLLYWSEQMPLSIEWIYEVDAQNLELYAIFLSNINQSSQRLCGSRAVICNVMKCLKSQNLLSFWVFLLQGSNSLVTKVFSTSSTTYTTLRCRNMTLTKWQENHNSWHSKIK